MTADFTAFVDESFYKWFGLPTNESNLCYGALTMPTARLAELDRFEAAIRKYAFDHLPADGKSKRSAAEVKYADFRHLSNEVIDELGRKLDYFLTKNGAYIFGFFIPAEGFMNYKLRSDFIDDVNALRTLPKEEYNKRIEEIRAGMLKEWEDAEHNIGLLTECYKTFFNFIVQFHGGFLKKTFRVVYDSRNPEEDAQLHRDAEEFAAFADRATSGRFAKYRGYEAPLSSNTPGLRLVDWIAGEVRAFFYKSPAVVGGDSSFDILSPYWKPQMIIVDGGPFYEKELSAEAVACFNTTGRGFMLPQIKKHFASGLLTYYAQHGEARTIAIPVLTAFDMAD